MSGYEHWNIKDLIDAQLKISAEISSRIISLVQVESEFLTYAYDSNKYEETMSELIDLVRKGNKE